MKSSQAQYQLYTNSIIYHARIKKKNNQRIFKNLIQRYLTLVTVFTMISEIQKARGVNY